MKSVLFLDIDGVLVTRRSLMEPVHSGYRFNRFDPKCVCFLNHITKVTGADLVISSTWRLAWWPRLIAYLQAEGVTGSVRGRTPERPGEPRGHEIRQWLTDEKFVGPFVVLDDASDMADVASRHLRTSMEAGLTREVMQQAIDLLQGVPHHAPDRTTVQVDR